METLRLYTCEYDHSIPCNFVAEKYSNIVNQFIEVCKIYCCTPKYSLLYEKNRPIANERIVFADNNYNITVYEITTLDDLVIKLIEEKNLLNVFKHTSLRMLVPRAYWDFIYDLLN